MAAGIVTSEGEILNEVRYPTADDPERLVRSIARSIREVCDGYEVGGVCLAMPGLILTQENRVIFSPNLYSVERIPSRDELEPEIGLPLTVEDDAGASSSGEFWFGVGSDIEHLVFVTLGTSIGGSVISRGILLRGGARIGRGARPYDDPSQRATLRLR